MINNVTYPSYGACSNVGKEKVLIYTATRFLQHNAKTINQKLVIGRFS